MKWKVTRMCWEPGFLARVKEDADMIARKLNQKETSLLTFEMVCFLKKKKFSCVPRKAWKQDQLNDSNHSWYADSKWHERGH